MREDGEWTDALRDRHREVHDRAATAYEQAAQVHQEAAEFYVALGKADRAASERAAADADFERARQERRRATSDEPEPDSLSPADRLADIEARLARVRGEADTLVQRLRVTVETGRIARDPDTARDRVAQLRHDVDATAEELAGLRIAMETRAVIEQAKGMIMITLKVDADAAFDVLRKQSQTHHKKLVDVARELVAAGATG